MQVTGYELLEHPVFIVVAALCAARVTRLITTDTITEAPRLWASRWDFTNDLVHCPWCIGFWVSLATAAILPLAWTVVPLRVLAVALAINYAFAILESKD